MQVALPATKTRVQKAASEAWGEEEKMRRIEDHCVEVTFLTDSAGMMEESCTLTD